MLGTFPQVYLLGRLRGVDLKKEPDLHIALYHKASRSLGILGVLGDMAKGPIPILVGRSLGVEMWALSLAGLLVVLGQMWPLFLPSSGGRGNSTAITMTAALAPSLFLIASIPIGLGIIVRTLPRFLIYRQITSGPPSRSMPLGMIVGFALLPPASWGLGQPNTVTLAFLGLFLAIVIRRLTAGLWADLKLNQSRGRLFLNRLLIDRSFI